MTRDAKNMLICLARVQARNIILQCMLDINEDMPPDIAADEAAYMLEELTLRDLLSDTPPGFARGALDALIDRRRLHRKINTQPGPIPVL